MRNLMRADFFRLRKSRTLWLCVVGAFVLSAFSLRNIEAGRENPATLDVLILQIFPFLSIAHGAFVSLFLGIEYQDGTIRNKLIAGHSRTRVYLSSLVAATAGCFAILLGWLLGGMAAIPRLGWSVSGGKQLFITAALIVLLTMAEAAILTLPGMLLPNRAVSAVLSIMLMFGLLIVGSAVYNALCEPEMMFDTILTESGIACGEPYPNPRYISGALRRLYQFAADSLPSAQSILLANEEIARPVLSAFASFGIIFLTSTAGVLTFKRKNLK